MEEVWKSGGRQSAMGPLSSFEGEGSGVIRMPAAFQERICDALVTGGRVYGVVTCFPDGDEIVDDEEMNVSGESVRLFFSKAQ